MLPAMNQKQEELPYEKAAWMVAPSVAFPVGAWASGVSDSGVSLSEARRSRAW